MSLQLSAGEARLIAAAGDAFFPPGGPIRRSGSEAGCVAWFELYLGLSGRRQRLLVRAMLAFVQLAPLLLGPERRRFTRASPEARIAFLARASTSRIYFLRVVFLSLRALMTMAYLADQAVADAIGIRADTDPFGLGDAPPLERVSPPTPQASGVRLKRGPPADPELGDVG
ncbi:MAG: hypothetical protein RIF41_28010 [Polyangiaceae bacterium]